MDPLNRRVTEALAAVKTQLEAGISATEAFELASVVCGGEAGIYFERAGQRAAQGHGIEAMLNELSPALPEAERATISAGWNAGRAESAFQSVVLQRELWYGARKRVINKLILPAATLLIATMVAPLPGLVLGYYGIFTYMLLAGTPLMIAGVLLFLTLRFLRKRALERVSKDDGSPLPASSMDRTLLMIPICARIESQRSLAEFGTLLANLINAGLPIAQALLLAARAMRNGCYRESVVRVSYGTAEGHAMTAAIHEEPASLWPREFVAAVAVGERSGTLDSTLQRLANEARENYVRTVERLAEWVPRLIYGCVALFVIACIFILALRLVGIYDGLLKGI